VRIHSLRIGRWRNLEHIELVLDVDADYLCLVGENGTGKSSLLELLSVAAHHLGLTPGVALRRPHPRDRQDPHDVDVTLEVRDIVSLEAVRNIAAAQPHVSLEHLDSWDGTVIFQSTGVRHPDGDPPQPPPYTGTSTSVPGYSSWTRVLAGGGLPDVAAFQLAGLVVTALQQRPEVLHLYVDAERVFPRGFSCFTDLSEFVTVEFERRAREKAMDLSLDRSAMCRGPDGPGRVCTRSRNGSFSPLRK